VGGGARKPQEATTKLSPACSRRKGKKKKKIRGEKTAFQNGSANQNSKTHFNNEEIECFFVRKMANAINHMNPC
jgi:hypothetical protein